MTLKKGAGFGEGGWGFGGDSNTRTLHGGFCGLGEDSRTVRDHEAGPYLRVGKRHSDVGKRLSDRLGLVGKV